MAEKGNVTRGGENTGVKKERELFAVMVNFFPPELRDSYLSTVLEYVSLQTAWRDIQEDNKIDENVTSDKMQEFSHITCLPQGTPVKAAVTKCHSKS